MDEQNQINNISQRMNEITNNVQNILNQMVKSYIQHVALLKMRMKGL